MSDYLNFLNHIYIYLQKVHLFETISLELHGNNIQGHSPTSKLRNRVEVLYFPCKSTYM